MACDPLFASMEAAGSVADREQILRRIIEISEETERCLMESGIEICAVDLEDCRGGKHKEGEHGDRSPRGGCKQDETESKKRRKRRMGSNNNDDEEEEDAREEERKRLIFSVGSLLLISLFQLTQFEFFPLVGILPLFGMDGLEVQIIYGLVWGATCMLAFVGGNLADAYFGRVTIMTFSLAAKLIGILLMMLAYYLPGSLFGTREAEIQYIHWPHQILFFVGGGIMMLGGLGESTLEVLIGDQFALSNHYHRLGTLGWDLFVMAESLAQCFKYVYFILSTTNTLRPYSLIPFAVFSFCGLTTMIILIASKTMLYPQPQGARAHKLWNGFKILCRGEDERASTARSCWQRFSFRSICFGASTTASSSTPSSRRPVSSLCSTRVSSNRSIPLCVYIGDSFHSLKVCRSETNISLQLGAIEECRNDNRLSAMASDLRSLPPLPPPLQPPPSPPLSQLLRRRGNTEDRIKQPVEAAMADDARRMIRIFIILLVGATWFACINWTMLTLVRVTTTLTSLPPRPDESPKSFAIQATEEYLPQVISSFSVLVFVPMMHAVRWFGLRPLDKMLLGIFLGFLAILTSFGLYLAAQYAEPQSSSVYATHLDSGKRDISRYWVIVPYILLDISLATHMLGGLEFLYFASPPFIRCSCMGLFMLFRGLGVMLSVVLVVSNQVVDDNFFPGVRSVGGPRDPLEIPIFYGILAVLNIVNGIVFWILKAWWTRKEEEEGRQQQQQQEEEGDY